MSTHVNGGAPALVNAGNSGAPVLVTGANGALGTLLLRSMRLRGVPVRAAVRSERARRALSEASGPAVDIRRVDYTDADSLSAAMTGCRGVVHLVGILKETRQSRYRSAHEDAATALVGAMEKARVGRAVAVSIAGADASSTNRCLASRGRADVILSGASAEVCILRAPLVLAPGTPAVHALYARACGRRAALWGDGSALEQPLDARDLIDAIVVLCYRDAPLAGTFDLGGPEILSYRTLVERAASLLGTRPRTVGVPIPLLRLFASVSERLFANPPITPDMLGVLLRDDRLDSSPLRSALELGLRDLDDTLRHVLKGELRR